MADPSHDWQTLFEPVRSTWTPHRANGAQAAIMRRLQRRRRLRRTAAVTVLLLAGGVGLFSWREPRPAVTQAPMAVVPTSTAAGALHLDDGSQITPLGASSDVKVVDWRAERRRVRLGSGGARFRVAHAPDRPFEVEAGAVLVRVLGTTFTVEHQADGRVRVAVAHGRVAVTFAGGTAQLATGEQDVYPLVTPAATPRPRATGRGWRQLAQEGRFPQAYRALQREDRAALADEPGALLLAADVARYAGHPADAVAPLRTLVDRHADDPRAPLAAFTLGRVLLDELGRPRDGAAAFARSRALDPHGDLAEDALAREVECWSRAADATRAHERALEYLRLYPAGRRLQAVRTFGAVP